MPRPRAYGRGSGSPIAKLVRRAVLLPGTAALLGGFLWAAVTLVRGPVEGAPQPDALRTAASARCISEPLRRAGERDSCSHWIRLELLEGRMSLGEAAERWEACLRTRPDLQGALARHTILRLERSRASLRPGLLPHPVPLPGAGAAFRGGGDGTGPGRGVPVTAPTAGPFPGDADSVLDAFDALEEARLRYLGSAGELYRRLGGLASFVSSLAVGEVDPATRAAAERAAHDRGVLLQRLHHLELWLGEHPSLAGLAGEGVVSTLELSDACEAAALRRRMWVRAGAGVATGLTGAAALVLAVGAAGTMGGGIILAAALHATGGGYLAYRSERAAWPESSALERSLREAAPDGERTEFQRPDVHGSLADGRDGAGQGEREEQREDGEGEEREEGAGEGDEFEGEQGATEPGPRRNRVPAVLPPPLPDEALELPPMLDADAVSILRPISLSEAQQRIDEVIALDPQRHGGPAADAAPLRAATESELIEEAREALALWVERRELSPGFGAFFLRAELEDLPASRRPAALQRATDRYAADRSIYRGSESMEDLRRRVARRLVVHCRGGSARGDLILQACTDPSALTLVIVAAIRDAGLQPPSGSVVGVQARGAAFEPVLFFRDPGEVVSLSSGGRTRGVSAPLYHPAAFYYSFLVERGVRPDLDPDEHLLIARADPGMAAAEEAADCAEPKSGLARAIAWVRAKVGLGMPSRRAPGCTTAGVPSRNESREGGGRSGAQVTLPRPAIPLPTGGGGQGGGSGARGSGGGGSKGSPAGSSGGRESGGGSGGGEGGGASQGGRSGARDGEEGTGASGSSAGAPDGAGTRSGGGSGSAGSGSGGSAGAGAGGWPGESATERGGGSAAAADALDARSRSGDGLERGARAGEGGAAEGRGQGSGAAGGTDGAGSAAAAAGGDAGAGEGSGGTGGGAATAAEGGDPGEAGEGGAPAQPGEGSSSLEPLDLGRIGRESAAMGGAARSEGALRLSPWRLRENFTFGQATGRVYYADSEQAVARFRPEDGFITMSPSVTEEQRRMFEAESFPVFPFGTECSAPGLPPRGVFRRATGVGSAFRYVFCNERESMVVFRTREDAERYARLAPADRPLLLTRLASERIRRFEESARVGAIRGFLRDPEVLRSLPPAELDSLVATAGELLWLQETLESSLFLSMRELEGSAMRAHYYDLHSQVARSPFILEFVEAVYRFNQRLASDPLRSLAWANSLPPDHRQRFFRLYFTLGGFVHWPRRWEALHRRYGEAAPAAAAGASPTGEASLDFLQVLSDPTRVRIDWPSERPASRASIHDRRAQQGRESTREEKAEPTAEEEKERQEITERRRGGTRGLGRTGVREGLGPEQGRRPLQIIHVRMEPETGESDHPRLPENNPTRPGGTRGTRLIEEESATRQEPVLWVTPETFVDAILSAWDHPRRPPAEADGVPPIVRFSPRLRERFLSEPDVDDRYETRISHAVSVLVSGGWLRYHEVRDAMGGRWSGARAHDTGRFAAEYARNALIVDQDQVRGPSYFTRGAVDVPADLLDRVRHGFSRYGTGSFDLERAAPNPPVGLPDVDSASPEAAAAREHLLRGLQLITEEGRRRDEEE
jgi:hypothetical protein